jgi:hypothetical protein
MIAVMRLLPLVLVLVVAGCGGGPDPAPPPRSTTTTTTTPAMSEDLGAKMGAASTMLTYCAPGLPGDRDCDWGRISTLLTEVTTGLRTEQGLTAEPDALDAAIAAFGPCTEWFNTSGAVGDAGTCGQAWYAVTSAWSALQTAAHWP